MPKYEVRVVFREQVTYIVEAEDGDAAEALAHDMWVNDEPAVIGMGNNWAEVERITAEEMK